MSYKQAEQVLEITGGEEAPWVALLKLMPECSPGRLIYCLALKRWLDVVLAACILVVVSPLLVVVAAAVWVQLGRPIIFRQTRIGRYGRPIVMLKFRTMIPDRRKTDRPFDGPNRRFRNKSPDDPRVTRLGRLLRRTSIDELPQLFNVLRGDMSLVGPRPEQPFIVDQYEPWQHDRFLVRPGLTGWWQIQGRADLPMEEHTELDIYYVAHQSFWLDLKILVKTFGVLVSRAGAF